MYYVNKVVGWLLSPFGIAFLGFAACTVSTLLKRRRLAWICGIVSVAILWIFGCAITTRIIGRPLERGYDRDGVAHSDVGWAPKGDAIVVLGGGMGVHEKCGASEMFGGADRVWIGSKLYNAGKAQKIICTGSEIERATLPLLIDFGVPREAVFWYDDARNTEEEARLIAKTLGGDGKKPKILLITSAWHMNRAKFLFEKAGVDVVPCPGDFEMSFISERPFSVKDFIPDAMALAQNSAAVREWVGIWAYRVLKGR